VYAGGNFTTIGGQTRNRIAALDATLNTNHATAWNPNANQAVSALAVSGSTVYAGGAFTTIGGQTRNRIAALDATSGLATTWNPNSNAAVTALAVGTGAVYAGGSFFSIGGQTRNDLAALNTTTGAATSWNSNADNSVLALAVSGNAVYAGGTFGTLRAEFRPFFGGVAEDLVAVGDSPGGVLPGTLGTSPNPFRAQVSLSFQLSRSGETEVAVYDLVGRLERRLHRGPLDAGLHQFTWDGRNESGQRSEAGLYFVRVDAGKVNLSTKVLRLK
jgi:hypothetical protein